ncbi:hypothetical protein [Zhenpiania hominis]|uniref:Uncharacterized protein n=1 Tax=Zhenpiania hominis TaxID=2763644 RepID=A0A923SSA2_9FIRM|nr:hypothetical protein [Zhenpiania hominis]MBC6681460.1 hypothetical protein [Zhenpiania hominis]
MPCLFCETKQRAGQIQKLRGFSRSAIFQFMPCLFCETKQRAGQIQKLRGFSRSAIFQFMPCLFCETKQRAGNTVLPNKKKANYIKVK